MFKNYVKIAFRNLLRQKIFSSINIVGLAIGLTCSILLSLWIMDEISFDTFHENRNNLYRIIEDQKYSSQNMQVAVTPVPLAESLKEDFPEVLYSTKYYTGYSQTIKVGETQFTETCGAFAESDFFDMFTFPIIKGSQMPFPDKNSLVLTESLASKLFGDEEALGQIVSIYDSDFHVTAIMKDVPKNSHISFGYILPFQVLLDRHPDMNNWGNNCIHTYVQLENGTSCDEMSEKIKMYLKQEDRGSASELYLQPITKTHLHSVGFVADYGGMGDFRYIILFSIISVFIIIISSVNFISLSTARYTKRAKEVGLRKVVGSQRNQLIWQFLGESMLLILISLIVALILVEIFLPAFNNISVKNLAILVLFKPMMMAGLVAFLIILGFLTGIYPAFMLSSFNPIATLKGNQTSISKGAVFRKIMVVTQWTLSIILIISTLVISKQLQFMKNKKLGFEKDNIVYTSIRGYELSDECKEELLKHPGVQNVSATSNLPNNIMSSSSGGEWDGKNDDDSFLIHFNVVDYDFIETFNIEMAEGRSFSREFSDKENYGFILNEEAIKQMGIKDPVGKKYSIWGMDGQIVGVMKDFHFKSLHNPIEPIVFMMIDDYLDYLVVKINTHDQENTISYLEETANRFDPDKNHGFRFFDARYDSMYRSEQQMEVILKIFAALAIFIACLGLFGLSTFLAQQRTKEIGIRKVLGANVPNIIIILSKEFTKWVIVANLIGCPIAYFILKSILQDFAYRVHISYLVFGITICLSILISIITISFQTIRAANANPIKSLKYE